MIEQYSLQCLQKHKHMTNSNFVTQQHCTNFFSRSDGENIQKYATREQSKQYTTRVVLAITVDTTGYTQVSTENTHTENKIISLKHHKRHTPNCNDLYLFTAFNNNSHVRLYSIFPKVMMIKQMCLEKATIITWLSKIITRHFNNINS